MLLFLPRHLIYICKSKQSPKILKQEDIYIFNILSFNEYKCSDKNSSIPFICAVCVCPLLDQRVCVLLIMYGWRLGCGTVEVDCHLVENSGNTRCQVLHVQ